MKKMVQGISKPCIRQSDGEREGVQEFARTTLLEGET